MAKEIVLEARVREGIGRQSVRKLRNEGLLPGVIYGGGMEPRSLSVPKQEFVRTLHQHGAHPLVTLRVDGADEYLAIVKEVQVDAVKNLAIHVDFLFVREDVPVATVVEVLLTGVPEGVRTSGGVLEQVIRTLDIEALPRSIPESLELDVSALEIGENLRVGDIEAPEGVRILTDPDEAVATVSAPRVEVEAPAEGVEGEELAEGEEPEGAAAAEGETPSAEASADEDA